MLLATKLKFAIASALVAGPLAVNPPQHMTPDDGLVDLASAKFTYYLAGDFSRFGKPAAAPLRSTSLGPGLRIMKRQVTAAEYTACVQEGGCARSARPDIAGDKPAVGVNWHDATAYARWLSGKSGISYRLPTDEEWIFAAGERARDEPVPVVDPDDPSKAWLARYEAETARNRTEAAPKVIGAFGANSKGILDIAGNVWEWTNSCFERGALDSGETRITNVNCGVRIVQGAHRAYMTDFIRDPRLGGCAGGAPPANLGFRLVVERPQQPLWRFARSVGLFGSRSMQIH